MLGERIDLSNGVLVNVDSTKWAGLEKSPSIKSI